MEQSIDTLAPFEVIFLETLARPAAAAPDPARIATLDAAAWRIAKAVIVQAVRDLKSIDPEIAGAARYWLYYQAAAWAAGWGLDIEPSFWRNILTRYDTRG